MNVTDSEEEILFHTCDINKIVWTNKYYTEKLIFAVISVILSGLSFPVTILMNTLVIVAVKTRPRLQTNYNILLACLAGTDLLVGMVFQPLFIARTTSFIRGVSLNEYCQGNRVAIFIFTIPILSSLFHLTLLSVDRFVALKYTFRYTTIVTTRRLTVAVVTSWFLACLAAVLRSLSGKLAIIIGVGASSFALLNVFIIIFCHISVYFVTRRHEKQIKSEQVSLQAAADFPKEKKALKTTQIIILALLVCYFPTILHRLVLIAFAKSSNYIITVIILSSPITAAFLSINSVCNPFIYCYRNRTFRETCKELLKMNCSNVQNEE